MFWRRFGKRTTEYPGQYPSPPLASAELKKRLVELLRSDPAKQYTLRHLEQRLHPVRLSALALALGELQAEGLIDRIIRVESPETGGGIEDFQSPDKVPPEIYDWRTHRPIAVDQSNTAFLFRAHPLASLERTGV